MPCQANDDGDDNEGEEGERNTSILALAADRCGARIKFALQAENKREPGRLKERRHYLVVVVVGQVLAVQPHPPPLEDAIPAGKKRGVGVGGAHRQRQSVKGGRDGDEARRRREVV